MLRPSLLLPQPSLPLLVLCKHQRVVVLRKPKAAWSGDDRAVWRQPCRTAAVHPLPWPSWLSAP